MRLIVCMSLGSTLWRNRKKSTCNYTGGMYWNFLPAYQVWNKYCRVNYIFSRMNWKGQRSWSLLLAGASVQVMAKPQKEVLQLFCELNAQSRLHEAFAPKKATNLLDHNFSWYKAEQLYWLQRGCADLPHLRVLPKAFCAWKNNNFICILQHWVGEWNKKGSWFSFLKIDNVLIGENRVCKLNFTERQNCIYCLV